MILILLSVITLVEILRLIIPHWPVSQKRHFKQKLGAVDGITAVDVDVTFSPPWQPSQELREMLGVA